MVCVWSRGRKVTWEWEWGERRNVRTWHGRCVHPKMYVVPERIQPICAHANPVGRGHGILIQCLTSCLGITLYFFEEPSNCAAPRDNFRMRVMECIATYGQTTSRETFHASAEGDELDAARVLVVERKAS